MSGFFQGKGGETISLKVNGKRFRYRERSVVVVCNNMNATDVQALVGPSLSLSDCLNKGTGAAGHKSRCIQLLKDLPQLKSTCLGEPGLCKAFNDHTALKCSQGNVTCSLLRKVQTYLGEHLKDHQEAIVKNVTATPTDVAAPSGTSKVVRNDISHFA